MSLEKQAAAAKLHQGKEVSKSYGVVRRTRHAKLEEDRARKVGDTH